MNDLVEKVLGFLSKTDKTNTLELSEQLIENHQKVIGALKSIQSNGEILIVKELKCCHIELIDEGEEAVHTGSAEAKFFNSIPDEGISQDKLLKQSNTSVGFSKAISLGWILVDMSGKVPMVRKKVAEITDATCNNLKLIKEKHSVPDNIKNEYKKRKLIKEVTIKSFDVAKGPNFSLTIKKYENDLTTEMLSTGDWKILKFKKYNFNALGLPVECGHLHPLLKVRMEFRQIFLEMGFAEMPTNNYIESSFWNFDALFQPQLHPARDAHDTFFVSDPETSEKFPNSYLKKVKDMHCKGGYGSLGYRYDWKIEETKKNLLRTHTTAVSARMLYFLAQTGFKGSKFFSIDKVFRNETLDVTHLAEFHQIEGVFADYNLNLGDLMGIIAGFFEKLGITQLKFKPAYNPYTEPSMEIFSYHSGLHKYIEIGNSGIFRPEVLLPMGFPENARVLAWGLSLERPTMIKYGFNNIRELVGHKVDLCLIKSNPICRFDKII